jgi:hypothetical protein
MTHACKAIQEIIAGVPVSLYIPFETAQECAGHTGATGLVISENQYRAIRVSSPENPHIGPGCGRSPRFGKYLKRSLVCMHIKTGQKLVLQQVQKHLAGRCRLYGPPTHGSAAYINTQSLEKLLLPVKWKVVHELAYQDVRQESRACNGFRDDLGGCRGYGYCRTFSIVTFAVVAGILGAYVTYDTYFCRNDIELLRYFLPDTLLLAATTAYLFLFRDVMDHIYPWKFLGKGPAATFLAPVLRDDYLFSLVFELFRLGHVKKRFDLYVGRKCAGLFAIAAKHLLAKKLDLLQEYPHLPLVVRFGLGKFVLQFQDHDLKLFKIIGQYVRGLLHAHNLPKL